MGKQYVANLLLRGGEGALPSGVFGVGLGEAIEGSLAAAQNASARTECSAIGEPLIQVEHEPVRRVRRNLRFDSRIEQPKDLARTFLVTSVLSA
ncbi:hypothetical protein MnTg02_01843 [bacterium MnTg02]|nr:hypothetical protein MnTg02_01843 [bacterium MnTg02]